MLVAHRQSNETLVLLQCAASAGYVSMPRMRSQATTSPSAALAAPARDVARLQADLAAVHAELASVRAERDQLRAILTDLLAEQVQLRAQVAQTQAQLATLDAERHDLHQELVDLKRKPFTSRQQRHESSPAKPRGRAVGHPGSGRSRPTRIDRRKPFRPVRSALTVALHLLVPARRANG
jgi:cell division protein FtsB